MREIKFRGKGIDGEPKWEYGNLVRYVEDGKSIYCIVSHDDSRTFGGLAFVEVDPATVGQYWFGKGENELYTGDILGVYSDCFTNMQEAMAYEADVRISAIGPFGEIEVPEEDYDQTHVCWLDDNAKHYEKLGNIHDNPELLNQ